MDYVAFLKFDIEKADIASEKIKFVSKTRSVPPTTPV